MRVFGELNFHILIITCYTLFVNKQVQTLDDVDTVSTANEHVTGTSQSDQPDKLDAVRNITSDYDKGTTDEEAKAFFDYLVQPRPPRITKIDFVQKLDHFNHFDDRTWIQRAYFKSQYERDDSPALLYIGELDGINPNELESTWLDLIATELGVPLYILENRYHGESVPTDLSTENLKYSRTEQVLADIEFFIKKTKHATRKWIVCGKEYGGTLAAWFRVKYPHVVDSVVVFHSQLNALTQDPDYLNIAAHVDGDKNLLVALQDVFEEIRKAVRNQKYEELKEKFNMCTKLNEGNNKDENGNFMYWSLLFYAQCIIFSEDTDMKAYLMDESTENLLDRFASIVKILNIQFNKGKCFSVDYDEVINQYKNLKIKYDNEIDYPYSLKIGFGSRPSFYKSCTEYGTFATSKGEPEELGVKINLDFYLKACEHTFDKKFDSHIYGNAIDTTNMFYGGEHIAITNLIYVAEHTKTWDSIGIAESEFNELITFNYDDSNDPDELLKPYKLIISKLNEWMRKKSVVGATKKEEENVVSEDVEEVPAT